MAKSKKRPNNNINMLIIEKKKKERKKGSVLSLKEREEWGRACGDLLPNQQTITNFKEYKLNKKKKKNQRNCSSSKRSSNRMVLLGEFRFHARSRCGL